MDTLVRPCRRGRRATALVGAEVDRARAQVTLIRIGVTLSGLQVTDPFGTVDHSIEVSRIAFRLDSLTCFGAKGDHWTRWAAEGRAVSAQHA